MAKTERKGSKNFDFNKRAEKRFDFTKDEADEVEVIETTENKSEVHPNPKSSSTSKIVGGLAVVALVGLLCYGANTLLSSSDDNNNSSTTIEQVDNGASVDEKEDNKATEDQSETETTDNDNFDSGTVTAGETTNTPSNEETPNVQTTKPEQDMTAKSTNVKTNASKLSTNESVNLSGTLEQKAKDVIRGNFGNGEVRKQKLGDQYSEIQNKVNEMYRNGLVK